MNIKRLYKHVAVGFSLFIGFMPLITKINRSTLKAKSSNPLSLYDLRGEWLSEEDTLLKIDENTQIFLNNQPIQLSRKETKEDQLILQDKFGYHITITVINEDSLTFHDEVEDASFTFIRKK